MFEKRILAPLVAATALAAAAPAAAVDYAGTARNVIPSGQWGSFPQPPGADSQARMYDGLTPLFRNVTLADLTKYFKSEALGVNGPAPRGNESVPRAGVKIVRDAFHVPHIAATTRDGATWAAGWVTEEDRALLLQFGRGPAYAATVDPPGIDAFGLVTQARAFTPSAQTRAFVARQTQLLQHGGPKGTELLHDIDVFIGGINDRLKFEGSSQPPWTRTDIYAVNALLGSFLGEGGGDEARRSMFLNGLRRRLGSVRGNRVFDDLRERNDPETSYTIDGRFPYGAAPRDRSGSIVLRNGSLDTSAQRAAAVRASSRRMASNVLTVSARRSTNGHPLFVGGPQIGYFYPGLTLEMDVNAPGTHWRGATSVPFPGYVLIGRGEDFANSLSSANGDIVDLFAERLCGGDRFHYLFKGSCLAMGTFDAGRLGPGGGEPGREVVFRTTVHGPVAGYARTAGSDRLVAISSARSSRGREVLFQLAFQDLTRGRVHDPQSFFDAFSQSPFTFNAFYVDSKQIAEYTAGRLPLRAPDVDPSLPADGSGAHEWRGFLAADAHPHGTDPAAGVMTNWNNRSARDFRAADDEFGYSSIMRDELLKRELARRQTHNLATVTGAMNAAATQDVRAVEFVPTLAAILSTGAPNARDARMLELLVDWNRRGGSRLDRDLDGKIDHPGAAILDAAWDGLANAAMTPVLGVRLRDQLATLISRFNQPPGGQFSGWMGYMDKDIRTLLGRGLPPVAYSTRYCGRGDVARCRATLWAALDSAGDRLQAAQGPHPAKWRGSAEPERIQFGPIPLREMRYTNRPSGIQQVITFVGHR